MAYEGGFQIGKEIGAINIPSMDKQLDLYTKMNAARSVNEQRQKAAREKRVNDVIDEQRKENAEFIYEDKIDDIGLEKPDQAAAKFQQVLKNAYERDTFAFQKGALSEKDYTANNSRRKASVKQVMGIYKKAGDFIEEHKGLVEAGKNNFLNDFKAEIIGNHMKHIAFSNKLDGTTEVQTINEKGQVTNMLSSTLESIATTEVGLKPDSIVNKLVSEAGFIKYDSASGRYRFTDYASGKNKERTKRLLDAAFEGYTDGQYMDLLNNLGGVSTNAEDAKREGLIYIDANNFLRKSPEEIQEIKKEARKKMTQYFDDRLELKESRSFTPIGERKVDKSLVSTTRVTNEDANDNKGDRIRFSPNKLQGLPMSYIEKYKGFAESIDEAIAKQNLLNYEVDATKDAKFLGANYFPDKGIFEIEIGYDVIKPSDDLGVTESTRKPVKSTMYLRTLADINDFYAGVGRKDLMISSKDWEAKRAEREKAKSSQGVGSKYKIN